VQPVNILKAIHASGAKRTLAECLAATAFIALLTEMCHRLNVNVATCALLYVIVVAVISRVGSFGTSIVTSAVAALGLAYFAPPRYSFKIADPLDVVAVVTLFGTSLIISRLVFRVRRMAEEALSTVNRGLIDAEERERARIARDLHDDVGQRMALMSNRLQQLMTEVPDLTIDALATIGELYNETEEIASSIQALSHTLHSSKLEYLGLRRTMKSFCEEFAQQQKAQVEFRSKSQTPLPLDVSLSLLRVLQEALHNSLKHSGTRKFEVELFEDRNVIHLIVRDSGIGFNPTTTRGLGLGLISMQERMKLVKGALSIDSQPMHGTTIHALVPVDSGTNSKPEAIPA
jgi:signal transduction histidine kinase